MSALILYRMFDVDGTLLYVGQSTNLGARLEGHQSVRPWMSDVATITLEHHATAADLTAAERHAVATEQPLYNVRLRSGAIPAARRRNDAGAINGSALRHHRRTAGLSAVELSAVSGVDPTVISRLESDTRRGTPAQIKALADALRVPITAIVTAA